MGNMNRRFLHLAAGTAAFWGLSRTASALDYPSRPVMSAYPNPIKNVIRRLAEWRVDPYTLRQFSNTHWPPLKIAKNVRDQNGRSLRLVVSRCTIKAITPLLGPQEFIEIYVDTPLKISVRRATQKGSTSSRVGQAPDPNWNWQCL